MFRMLLAVSVTFCGTFLVADHFNPMREQPLWQLAASDVVSSTTKLVIPARAHADELLTDPDQERNGEAGAVADAVATWEQTLAELKQEANDAASSAAAERLEMQRAARSGDKCRRTTDGRVTTVVCPGTHIVMWD